MDQTPQSWDGKPLDEAYWHKQLRALPTDLSTRLMDYAEPPFLQKPASVEPKVDPKKTTALTPTQDAFRATIRRGGNWHEQLASRVDPNSVTGRLVAAVNTKKAKIGAATLGALAPVALMTTGMSSVPVDANPSGNSIIAAAEPEDQKMAEELNAAVTQLHNGHRRGIVVIDPGHGHFMRKGKEVHDGGTEFESQASGGDILEDDMTEAYSAALAIELTLKGFEVRFTRKLDFANNGHLQNVPHYQRAFLKQIDHAPRVLPSRFEARHEVARNAKEEDPRTTYISVHVNSGNPEIRGGSVYMDVHSERNGPSAQLMTLTRDSLRDHDLMTNQPAYIYPRGERHVAVLTNGEPEPGMAMLNKLAPLARSGLGDIPAILVETQYRSNVRDRMCSRQAEGKAAMGAAIAEAVSDFYARTFERIRPSTFQQPTVQNVALAEMPDVCRTGSATPNTTVAGVKHRVETKTAARPAAPQPNVRTHVSFVTEQRHTPEAPGRHS